MSQRLQIEVIQYRQIATQVDCYNALSNDIAAVYAWFQDLTLSKDVLASEEKFVSTVMELLGNPLSEKRENYIGPFYEIGLTAKPKELTSKKKHALIQYARAENIRSDIGNALEAATLLQTPLYIGKANKLAERIWAHVNRTSGLCDRLEKVGLSL